MIIINTMLRVTPASMSVTMVVTFDCDGGEKPVCVAETLTRVYA